MIDKDLRQRLAEAFRRHQSRGGLSFPSSASVIEAITSEPQPFAEGEPPEEITPADYDQWVGQALFDLVAEPQRFQAHPDNPSLIECPRKRLLRIGEEAACDGKPSAFFQEIMDLTDNGLELPHVTERARSTAQKYLNIAIAFKQFAKANHHKYKDGNFKDLKCDFRRWRDRLLPMEISESTLERALRLYGLNWSAYSIDAPRKGQRKKG